MYSDISQLIRDVVVLSRKSKDIELKFKINELINETLLLVDESSHSKVAALRKKALFEFADNFTYQQVKYNCKPVVDLHVYA